MAQADDEETFLTVAEVAATLKLNQQTVRNWIDQGSLPALRIGRRVRIRRSDFERLLDEGYRAAQVRAHRVDRPSAEDFWGGEPVGLAEPAPGERREPPDEALAEPGPGGRSGPAGETVADPDTSPEPGDLAAPTERRA